MLVEDKLSIYCTKNLNGQRKHALSPVQTLLAKASVIFVGLISKTAKGFIVLVFIIWKLLFLTPVMPGILTCKFLLSFKTS